MTIIVAAISLGGFLMLYPARFADFRSFYCAGRLIVDGRDPYREHPLHECEHRLASPLVSELPSEVTIPAPYPGYALALFAALSILPFTAAIVVWTLAACASLGFAVRIVADLTAAPYLAVSYALVFPAAVVALPLGQPTPFVLLALAGCAALLCRNRPRWAALAALGTALDPHVCLPLFLGLFAAVPRSRLALLSGGVALTAVDLLVAGPARELEYIRDVLPAHALANVAEFSQFSTTNAAFVAGASPALALMLGNVWYIAAVLIGVVMALRLRASFGAAAVALVPVAFAVFGGTHTHLQQLALAVPAFLLLASAAGGARRAILATLMYAAFIPWLIIVPFPVLYPAVALLGIAFAGSMATPQIGVALGAGSLCALALLCVSLVESSRLYVPFAALSSGNPLAQVSWSAFVQATSVPAQAWFVLSKIPTYAAFFGLLAMLVAAARKPENAHA